jgi:hypothetical protein
VTIKGTHLENAQVRQTILCTLAVTNSDGSKKTPDQINGLLGANPILTNTPGGKPVTDVGGDWQDLILNPKDQNEATYSDQQEVSLPTYQIGQTSVADIFTATRSLNIIVAKKNNHNHILIDITQQQERLGR